jgi:NADP-reducing hydrogenase subunit HndD
MYRDNEKCILCRRCSAVCTVNQAVSVIGANARGFDTHIGCAFEKDLGDVGCISCGQCITVCPTGALSERDDTQKVVDAIQDPEKFVVVQTAPSVRVAWARSSAIPSAPSSPARWSPPCGLSASTRCSTPTSPPT